MISRGALLKRKRVIRARNSFCIVGVGASAGATLLQTPSAAQFQNIARCSIDADVEPTAFTQVAALQVSSKAQDTVDGLP